MDDGRGQRRRESSSGKSVMQDAECRRRAGVRFCILHSEFRHLSLKERVMKAAKQNWAAFQKDPEWQKVATESQVNGKIVAKVESVFLDATIIPRPSSHAASSARYAA